MQDEAGGAAVRPDPEGQPGVDDLEEEVDGAFRKEFEGLLAGELTVQAITVAPAIRSGCAGAKSPQSLCIQEAAAAFSAALRISWRRSARPR